MDDEFSKALDSLHNSIDQAVDHVALPGPVRDSWILPEPPKQQTSNNATFFLIQIFFLLFAALALQYVYKYVQRDSKIVPIKEEPAQEIQEVPNLLQEDALTQAELEYLLKVKTAIREPEPEPIREPEIKPAIAPPIKTRPDHSFPIDEAVWIEPESS